MARRSKRTAAAARSVSRGRAFSHEHVGLRRGGVARDDLVDAAVVALSAARIARGQALAFPRNAPRDSKGLKMEIVI